MTTCPYCYKDFDEDEVELLYGQYACLKCIKEQTEDDA